MPKKKPIKVVDYRSVNLAWLVDFKDRVFSKELAPEIELVVAREDVGTGSNFEIHKGDTLCITGETVTAYTVSRPYGDVRTGEVPKSAVATKPREEWNTEDVAEYVIKRACMEDQCTYLEMIEQPKKNVSKNKYEGTFVSQARRCRFADLVGALQQFYTLKQAEIADQFVWLDIFSANQPKLTARNVEPAVRKENERQLTEGLHIAIANFEQRVMFMDKWDGAAPLTRAWCVWEIFGVAKAKKPLEIALPESEYDRYISFMVKDFFNVTTKLSKLDVAKAECFSDEDLQMIQSAIRKESSFAEVNDVVMSELRVWVASTAEAEMRKEEAKASPDESRIALLATCAGLTFQGQGQNDRAEMLLRKALAVAKRIYGTQHAETASTLNNLALLLADQGKLDKAKPMYEESLRIRRKVLGDEHPDVAESLSNLAGLLIDQGKYNEAEKFVQQALAICTKVHGREHPAAITHIALVGSLLQSQGKLDEAEPVLREVVELREKTQGNEHPHYASALNNLAGLLIDQGKYNEAEKFVQQALAICTKVHGREHPAAITHIALVGSLLQSQGKLDEAEPVLREVVELREKTQGNKHPHYASALNNLALLLKAQGNYDEAMTTYEESLRIRRKVLGNEHPDVAQSLNNLAELLRAQGKLAEARPLYEESIAIFKKVLGEEHPNVATLLNNIAELLSAQGKLAEARPLYEESIAIFKKVLGEEHPNVATLLNNIASLLQDQGKKQEARSKGKEALRIAKKVLGKDHPTTQQYRKYWGSFLSFMF